MTNTRKQMARLSRSIQSLKKLETKAPKLLMLVSYFENLNYVSLNYKFSCGEFQKFFNRRPK